MRLIEAEQDLAALDRANHLLKKTPNAAWLLAIKGEQALKLNELPTFIETADRFLKLKPDNPVALLMKAAAAILTNQPIDIAAHYLLQGLSESRKQVHPIGHFTVIAFIQYLRNEDKTAYLGFWAQLFGRIESELPSPYADPYWNAVSKAPVMVIPDSPGAEWKERLAEVHSLMRGMRYDQAESKLRAVLRDYPDQPGPLSQLLKAQIALIHEQDALSTARKLASHQTLDPAQRAYYGALSLELDPQRTDLQGELVLQYAEIDSVEAVTEMLDSIDFVEQSLGKEYEAGKAQFMAVLDPDSHASHIYTVYDRPLTASTNQDENSHWASMVSMIGVFGKQTDRPARLLMLGHRTPKSSEQIDSLLQRLPIGAELDASQLNAKTDYVVYLARAKRLINKNDSHLGREEINRSVKDDFLNYPQKLLDGLTPLQAAEEERFKEPLMTLLSHLEGQQWMSIDSETFDQIYAALHLERPKVTIPADTSSWKLNHLLELTRIDFEQVSDAVLPDLLQHAMDYHLWQTASEISRVALSRETIEDSPLLQLRALACLKETEADVDEQLELSKTMRAILERNNMAIGQVVVSEVSLLLQLARQDEATQLLIQSYSAHPEDPVLQRFMHFIFEQNRQGGANLPDQDDQLTHRILENAAHAREGAKAPESGLVLPGSDSAGQPASGKLWLPGS